MAAAAAFGHASGDKKALATPAANGDSGILRERIHVTKGTTMCEVGFLFGGRQEAEIEAVSQTTCLVLEKQDFLSIVKTFPEVYETAKARVIERLRDEESPLLEDIEANGKMGDGTPLPARTTQLTEELQREAQNAADRRAVKAP